MLIMQSLAHNKLDITSLVEESSGVFSSAPQQLGSLGKLTFKKSEEFPKAVDDSFLTQPEGNTALILIEAELD